MRLVFIGLSLSSSWGNGHATTYRALLRGLAARGHDLLFLERDQPWYAAHRDLAAPDFCRLQLYANEAELRSWRAELADADAVIIGSYVHRGPEVIAWAAGHRRGALCFYDIDTPVTLRHLATGGAEYLRPDDVALFDLYLSFTGGPTLRTLQTRYGARRTAALYCAVDAAAYRPAGCEHRWDLGYLGTYSADRQPALERLLLEPARRLPHKRFVVAGPQYPADMVWPSNVARIAHLPPAEHPAFYGSCRWTLNVTRRDMVEAGWSPSVRLFEATACGTPVLSDPWRGIEDVLAPGRELVIADRTEDVVTVLDLPEHRRASIGAAGRARTLRCHTGEHRARELEDRLRALTPARMQAYQA
jgi:spore maturation protein CgeB